MTKEQFKRHLTRLVELKKEVDKVEDVMRKSTLNDDFSGGLLGVVWYEDLSIKILSDAMDDTEGWVPYWIYDCEFGTRKELYNSVKDRDGKKIPFKTINDLYNCIINNI